MEKRSVSYWAQYQSSASYWSDSFYGIQVAETYAKYQFLTKLEGYTPLSLEEYVNYNGSIWEATYEDRRNRSLKEMASFLIGMSPADFIKDFADFIAGKDLITGEEMNRWVLLGFLLAPELVDQAVKQGRKLSTEVLDEGIPNPVGGACFTAGTLVSTEDGLRPIEEVKVGDYVWSENPETGEKGLKKVINTFIHDKYTLIQVYTGDTMIETTEEHPFWVEGKGWVFAGEINEGDVLRLKSGENVKVRKLERVQLKEPVKVYNFEVEDWHTYYVSDINVLVHNKAMKYRPVPDKAIDVLEKIDNNYGKRLDGYASEVFRNKPNIAKGETLIPNPNKNITYIEHDIYSLEEVGGSRYRGTERIVIGDDGSAFYTPDHYKTWVQLR